MQLASIFPNPNCNHREACSIALCSSDRAVVARKKEVSLGELAAKLALDKSVTNRRLRDVNLETRRARPARIVLGYPMPEMVKLLPEPNELAA